jgi:hypothetical protein
MNISRFPVWPIGVASALAGLASAYLWVVAASTASLRFGHCGPATADAPEQYCQVAVRVLHQSYGVGLLALVLAVVAIWVRAGRRKRGVGA